MKTVLFVGAGRHQRRAILQARERGLRVVAVDRNPAAPGLAAADVSEAVDFTDIAGVTEVARRYGIDGALTVSADRAVPVVAAVTERLGLPSIGSKAALRMTNKLIMRRALADAGVAQPPFAALGSADDLDAALSSVPLPAVLKPSDSGGQRGVFRVDTRAELERHLPAARAESNAGEAILEGFVEGIEMNGIVIARAGKPFVLTLSDRLRPAGMGFGVGWIHVYPARLDPEQLRLSQQLAADAVAALGLRDGIAKAGQFCIDNHLAAALKGDVKHGLFFRGAESLPFGEAIRPVLAGLGIPYSQADPHADLEAQVAAAGQYVDEADGPFALLLCKEDLRGG